MIQDQRVLSDNPSVTTCMQRRSDKTNVMIADAFELQSLIREIIMMHVSLILITPTT